MEIVWIVNLLVALLSFLIWRKTPAIIDVAYTFDSEDTTHTVNLIFTLFITLIGLSILPTVISAIASYVLLTLMGLPLTSFSVWAVYIPHGLVLSYFISRTCKAFDWKFAF